MNYRNKLEISFMDLLHYILKKWRSVIVCMIIGAILCGGYSYFKPEEMAELAEEIQKSEMSDVEMTEVLMAVQTYYDYKQTYEDKQSYVNNSILMHLDAFNTPTYTITYSLTDYVVEGKDGTVYDLIMALYRDKLIQEQVLKEIAEACGLALQEDYIMELYSVDMGGSTFGTAGLMNVVVRARSQEECVTIAKILEKYLDKSISEVKAVYTHNILKADERYYLQQNSWLSSSQKDQSDALANIEKTMLSIGNSLNDDQKALYTKLLPVAENYMDESKIIDTQALISTLVDSTEEAVASNKRRSISAGSILLGALLGAVIAILWHMIAYMMSNRLRSKEDISEAFGLSLLGEYYPAGDYTRRFGSIDKRIDMRFQNKGSMSDSEQQMNMISAVITIDATKNQYRKISITGTGSDSAIVDLQGKLKKNFDANVSGDYEVEKIANPIDDNTSLEKIAMSDAVVLVERIGLSKYADIEKMIHICSRFGITVLGVVLVH